MKNSRKRRFSLFEGDSLVLTASASNSNYKTNIYGISGEEIRLLERARFIESKAKRKI